MYTVQKLTMSVVLQNLETTFRAVLSVFVVMSLGMLLVKFKVVKQVSRIGVLRELN